MRTMEKKVDMALVNKTVELVEEDLNFPNTLMWGKFEDKEPHNVTVTLYDTNEEEISIRFLNRNRALIFTGKKKGLNFKGSIDKRQLVLLNKDYEIGFENLLDSVYRVEVNKYKYDINVGSLGLSNIIFEDARILIEYHNNTLDDRINTFIDLSYVQDMFLNVMTILWEVLPDVLDEIKLHLVLGYSDSKDLKEQLTEYTRNKKQPPS